ncbi:hypothetical protein QNI16_20700 [Cytophagaceae bacterium YF14B1]|uniref:Uncharacterized protein n=1 Tax=Xanthocytophaga flava TaxID=3048013 RepID=A0AAE3QUB7_9BACT|nr:hypothetical protein [Xanthocytophaga flavus]MDJ1482934.1 hypothetical protein [Xanthocytophaga flavus]
MLLKHLLQTEFLSLLNDSVPRQSSNLRFDGYYQRAYEEDEYHHGFNYKNGVPTQYIDTPYAVGPISFFEKGIILHEGGYFGDSVSYKLRILNSTKFAKNTRCWGVYKIKSDTIQAIIYNNYTGNAFKRHQYKQAYYQGIMRQDKILQWHLVPPYPDINDEINSYMVKKDKIPRDLFFKPNTLKVLIKPDSTAWINEFKNR